VVEKELEDVVEMTGALDEEVVELIGIDQEEKIKLELDDTGVVQK